MKLLEIIRDDGVTFNAGGLDQDFVLADKEGTASVEIEAFYQDKGYGYGDILTGRRVRGRTFTYALSATKKTAWARNLISSFFNPLHDFTIKSYVGGNSRFIRACIASLRPSEKLYGRAAVEVTFYAEDPFWKELTDTKRQFYQTLSLWHYPYALVSLTDSLPEGAYSTFEQVGFRSDLSVFNDGDVPTPLVIQLTGPVTNPSISVNDATISFTGTVDVDEVLYLDPANSVYTLDGVNVFKYVSIVGDPTLQIGDNYVVSSEEQYGTVIFYKQYNGDV